MRTSDVKRYHHHRQGVVILIRGAIDVFEFIKALLTDNWETVLLIVFTVLAISITGRRLAWWKWFNETVFYAWDSAEKKGLLEGIKGVDKLNHYLEVYRKQYEKKWGAPPAEGTIEQAVLKAAELSAKEKILRLSDPT